MAYEDHQVGAGMLVCMQGCCHSSIAGIPLATESGSVHTRALEKPDQRSHIDLPGRMISSHHVISPTFSSNHIRFRLCLKDGQDENQLELQLKMPSVDRPLLTLVQSLATGSCPRQVPTCSLAARSAGCLVLADPSAATQSAARCIPQDCMDGTSACST